MVVVQKRRIGLFLIFAALIFSLFSLDQVSFTNNYVSFIDQQNISVRRDHFSNNFVIQDKSQMRMDEHEFSVWEKKGDKGGLEGNSGVTTKPHVASSTKEAAAGAPAPTSRLSRIDTLSASRSSYLKSILMHKLFLLLDV